MKRGGSPRSVGAVLAAALILTLIFVGSLVGFAHDHPEPTESPCRVCEVSAGGAIIVPDRPVLPVPAREARSLPEAGCPAPAAPAASPGAPRAPPA